MIKVEFDHSQRRISADRLQVFACGRDFDTINFSNCWMDEVTFTIMLQPMFVNTLFQTTNTGIYTKLGLASFTPDDASKWEERQDNTIKGPWLSVKDTSSSGRTIISNDALGVNRGFYIATFMSSHGKNVNLLDFGINPTINSASGWYFKLWSGGNIDVYKNGVLIKQGNFHGKGYHPAEKKSSNSTSAMTLSTVELWIQPFRDKDLLIYSPSHGGGFYVTDPDTADDDEYPILISTTDKVWVQSVHGLTQVMICPTKYQSSGYVTSKDVSFYEPPVLTDVVDTYLNDTWLGGSKQYKIYASQSHGPGSVTGSISTTILDEDGATFVPNGSRQICKMKVSLSTDNANYSPFLYASLFSYKYRVDTTNDSEKSNVSEYLSSCTLSVGERPGDCNLDFELLKADEIEQTVTPKLSIIENRPVLFSMDEVSILSMVNKMKDDEYSWNDEVNKVSMECFTYWHMLEQYEFVERVPWDDFYFTEALKYLGDLSGISRDNMVITNSDFQIKYRPGKDANDFKLIAEVGDNADEWFIKLMTLFAPTWYYGVRPSPDGDQLYAVSPEDLGYEPYITLYSNMADAINEGGLDFTTAKRMQYRKYKKSYLEFEGNDVRVTGYDPRTDKVIQSYQRDKYSQEVTTAPSSRSDNWVGNIRRIGYSNPAYYSQSLVDDANDILFPRVSTRYRVSEIECDFLRDVMGIPYWRGIPIKLFNHNVVGRIQTFSCDFLHDVSDEDGWQFYEAKYVLRDPVTI